MARWSSSSCSASSGGRPVPAARGSPRARSASRSWSMSSRWSGYSLGELVEPRAGRPRRPPGARWPPRASGARPGHDAEAADEPRQRQALADERRDDDAERQEDDQVALREVGRQRRAPRPARPRRACPPSDTTKTARGGGYGSRSPDPRAEPARQVGRREDPHDPGDDDRQADGQPQPDAARRRCTPPGPARIAGSCSPMSMNTKPLIRKITTFHTPRPIRRPSGDRTRAAAGRR